MIDSSTIQNHHSSELELDMYIEHQGMVSYGDSGLLHSTVSLAVSLRRHFGSHNPTMAPRQCLSHSHNGPLPVVLQEERIIPTSCVSP